MTIEEEYDVVIVGAGVAGAIVAKTLANAGKRVLVLEAGADLDASNLSGPGALHTYQGYLERYYRAEAKTPNSAYPNLAAAPSPDVLDIQRLEGGAPSAKGYFVQTGPLPFGSDYARTPGGTTLHWLGTCLRALPSDFRMRSHYGVGVDWPLSYDDLRPYYEMAEHEIGVSADSDKTFSPAGSPDYFGGYVFPMHGIPQSYLDKEFAKAVDGFAAEVSNGAGGTQKIPIHLVPTPQGRNSTPNVDYRRKGLRWYNRRKRLTWVLLGKGETHRPVGATWDDHIGQRCEGNANCVPICPVQAKYNALKTLKSASRDRLTIISQAVAFEVEVQGGRASASSPVSGVKYKLYKESPSPDFEVRVARGRIYVLAANAVENAKLLLASGIANSSDQVGRNLMDHVTLLTWGLASAPVFPFRGPGSTSNIPVFRDADFRSQHAAFIVPVDNWGWNWPRFSPGSDLDDAVSSRKFFGLQLRHHLERTVTRQMFLHFECEQLPEPNNRITIDGAYRDRLGNYRPLIQYDISRYLKDAFARCRIISKELFKYAGIEDRTSYDPNDPCYFTHDGEGYFFRGAGHLAGTHRMGSRSDMSVVNREQRSWDHPNLFLIGCGSMATIGTSNPTLTMSALSFLTAEAILKELSRGR